jgi:predicted HTH transcriptional regulator
MSKFNRNESETLEFKETYTDTICKEIVSFLNANGGDIVLGVDNDGNIVGVKKIDEISRKISDVITTQIEPNPQELVSSELRYADGKTLLVIHVPKGTRPIYCQKKYGFSSTGCPIRIGTSCREMTLEQIKSRYEQNFTDTDYMTITPSRYGAISFRTLKIYYAEKGFHLDDSSFEANLGLKTPQGKYNLLAELMSDKNTIPLIVVKFNGRDKTSVSERSDYGFQCLLFAFEQVRNRLAAENIRVTDTTTRPRKDKTLFDFNCVNEAVINALVHNDWAQSQPLISLFEDRLEILSHGGLPKGETVEMFFQGISRPRNDMLMRIFLNMELTEHTGHGIPTIVSKYGREAFQIEDSYINVVIPFDAEVMQQIKNHVGLNVGLNVGIKLTETQKKVLSILLEDGTQNATSIANMLGVTVRTIERALTELRKSNLIIRSGSRKQGEWIVVK